MSLTAPERETVILLSDADDTATITTHQRKILSKLRKNPSAKEIEDLSFDGTAGATFEMPANLITFRSGKRKLTDAQRKQAAANLQAGRAQHEV